MTPNRRLFTVRETEKVRVELSINHHGNRAVLRVVENQGPKGWVQTQHVQLRFEQSLRMTDAWVEMMSKAFLEHLEWVRAQKALRDKKTVTAGAPAKPHVTSGKVQGAPFQIGEHVRVGDAVDRHVHNVAPFVGRAGVVTHLDYACDCGQTFPGDPMVGVAFGEEEKEEFWSEEIQGDPR